MVAGRDAWQHCSRHFPSNVFAWPCIFLCRCCLLHLPDTLLLFSLFSLSSLMALDFDVGCITEKWVHWSCEETSAPRSHCVGASPLQAPDALDVAFQNFPKNPDARKMPDASGVPFQRFFLFWILPLRRTHWKRQESPGYLLRQNSRTTRTTLGAKSFEEGRVTHDECLLLRKKTLKSTSCTSRVVESAKRNER